jgi:hypothetical protein
MTFSMTAVMLMLSRLFDLVWLLFLAGFLVRKHFRCTY